MVTLDTDQSYHLQNMIQALPLLLISLYTKLIYENGQILITHDEVDC